MNKSTIELISVWVKNYKLLSGTDPLTEASMKCCQPLTRMILILAFTEFIMYKTSKKINNPSF